MSAKFAKKNYRQIYQQIKAGVATIPVLKPKVVEPSTSAGVTGKINDKNSGPVKNTKSIKKMQYLHYYHPSKNWKTLILVPKLKVSQSQWNLHLLLIQLMIIKTDQTKDKVPSHISQKKKILFL